MCKVDLKVAYFCIPLAQKSRDTLIFLLQNLGFVINIGKSALMPVQEIEFLGLVINSVDMTLTLPEEKVTKLISQCQEVVEKPQITLWKLRSFLLMKGITLTAKYLPGILNHKAGWDSRHFHDSSEWFLSPQVFQGICCHWGQPDMDLFASRIFHHVQAYMAWRPDPKVRRQMPYSRIGPIFNHFLHSL